MVSVPQIRRYFSASVVQKALIIADAYLCLAIHIDNLDKEYIVVLNTYFMTNQGAVGYVRTEEVMTLFKTNLHTYTHTQIHTDSRTLKQN